MEKKKFELPEIIVLVIEQDEIITASYDPSGIMSIKEDQTIDVYNL